MANEISLTASLSCYKSSVMSSAMGRSVNGFLATMTGNFVMEGVILVGTSATLVPLGQVTAPGWAFFQNKDATNFIRLHNGSGGAKVVKMLAGEPAFFRVDDTATLYATADTAAANMEYMVFML